MENPHKMDDLGVPPFLETPIYHVYRNCTTCLYIIRVSTSDNVEKFFFFNIPQTIQGSEQTQSNSWVRDIRCNDVFFFAGSRL